MTGDPENTIRTCIEFRFNCGCPKCQRERVEALGHLDVLVSERAQLREALEEANGWLSGLEESFASPNRECTDEDVAADGTREGNSCIDSDPGDLEFPDDWCERCYILQCVRSARAALSDGPGADA